MTEAEFYACAKERFPDTNFGVGYFIYEKIAEQAAHDPDIPFGKGLRIMILSDRCPGRAFGLQEYLKEKTDVSEFLLLHELASVRDTINEWVPDVLIYVGYQRNSLNFKAHALVLAKNPSALVIMYAHLDGLIKSTCTSFSINYTYSSGEPVAGFVKYLSAILESNIAIRQIEA